MIRNQIRHAKDLPTLLNRRLSEKRLPPILDREFQSLLRDPEHGPIAKYLRGEIGIEGLIIAVEQNRRDWGGGNTSNPRAPMLGIQKRRPADLSRAEAVSEFLVALARKDEELSTFREKVLSGRVLKIHEVEAWILSKREQPSTVLKVILAEAIEFTSIEAVSSKIDLSKAIRIEHQRIELEFAAPPDFVIRSIPVKYGGVLYELGELSLKFNKLNWNQAQAVIFVLTDRPPLVNPLSSKATRVSASPVLDRIRMEIDPEISPQDVLRVYRRTLRQMPKPAVRLNNRRLRLAAFMLGRPEGETYKIARLAWNRANPDLEYGQDSNFGRDAKLALEATRQRSFPEMMDPA